MRYEITGYWRFAQVVLDTGLQGWGVEGGRFLRKAEPVQYPDNRKQKLPLDANDSVVGEVDKTTLLNLVDELSKEQTLNEVELAEQIISLAHEENVEEWSRAIDQVLQSLNSTVQLIDLQQILKMPMVEVLLGLLLGGYELEQKGRFYDAQNVWVQKIVALDE